MPRLVVAADPSLICGGLSRELRRAEGGFPLSASPPSSTFAGMVTADASRPVVLRVQVTLFTWLAALLACLWLAANPLVFAGFGHRVGAGAYTSLVCLSGAVALLAVVSVLVAPAALGYH